MKKVLKNTDKSKTIKIDHSKYKEKYLWTIIIVNIILFGIFFYKYFSSQNVDIKVILNYWWFLIPLIIIWSMIFLFFKHSDPFRKIEIFMIIMSLIVTLIIGAAQVNISAVQTQIIAKTSPPNTAELDPIIYKVQPYEKDICFTKSDIELTTGNRREAYFQVFIANIGKLPTGTIHLNLINEDDISSFGGLDYPDGIKSGEVTTYKELNIGKYGENDIKLGNRTLNFEITCIFCKDKPRTLLEKNICIFDRDPQKDCGLSFEECD